MGGNGLIVSFGEVMPMRLGRLQRQSRRAFWGSAAPEVSTSELAGWCWARQTLVEKRAPSRPSGRNHDPDRLPPRLAGVRVVRSAMVAGRAGHRPATRPQGEERLAECPSDAG